jgi:hypothetical protein
VKQAAYRVRQFFQAVLARVTAADLATADAHLPPPARGLFRQMTAADQQHGLHVLGNLQRSGYTQPALLAAALLHDVGKSAGGLSPIHRAIIVLFEHFWPDALTWLAREPAHGWRRPFVIQRCHPHLGATWARTAGCDSITVWLIENHQAIPSAPPQNEVEEWLAALQQADTR